MAARCPECGSTRIEQYMMPYGPMWCMDCGFRVEDKMAQPNPFIDTDEDETPAEPPAPPLPLGAALYELSRARKGTGGTDPPEAGQGGDRDPGPGDD
jgi:hypothetical protein